MIITRDMLIQKGVAQDILDDFDLYCPFGFNCCDPTLPYYSFETDIMQLVGYTGTVTHESTLFNPFCRCNYLNGLLHNFPNGDPAFVSLYYNNTLCKVLYYMNGKRQNPAKYLPAFLLFDTDGTLIKRTFYINDIRDDPLPGVPADACYDKQGNLFAKRHYKAGVLVC